MRRAVRRFILGVASLCLLVPLSVLAATTEGATALDRFLDGLTTWRAEFTQTVVDAKARKLGEGSGRLLIARPGRFRWEMAPKSGSDGGQLLLADGRNLWFLDRDLAQVTVKPLTASLAQSPAMLLSGSGDVRAAFDVATDGRGDGLDWVRVKPKQSDGDFRQARLGFRNGGLERMELEDRLGQKTTLRFSGATRNVAVPPEDLRFDPPAGADVIGTPLP